MKLCLAIDPRSNSYCLGKEVNGKVQIYDQQMVPAQSVVELLATWSKDADEHNKKIEQTKKAVTVAQSKATPSCLGVQIKEETSNEIAVDVTFANKNGTVSIDDWGANLDGFDECTKERLNKIVLNIGNAFDVYLKHIKDTMKKELEAEMSKVNNENKAE